MQSSYLSHFSLTMRFISILTFLSAAAVTLAAPVARDAQSALDQAAVVLDQLNFDLAAQISDLGTYDSTQQAGLSSHSTRRSIHSRVDIQTKRPVLNLASLSTTTSL